MESEPRNLILTWNEVDRLIDSLLPKFKREFHAMLMITRGGVIPGGMLAERMGLTQLLTAAVDFPAQLEVQRTALMAWPTFIQFPADALLVGQSVLVVDDVWGSGRTIIAVKNRVSASGGFPETCVLHFNPYRNLFASTGPDYYAEVTQSYVIYPWEMDRGAEHILTSGNEP